MTGPLLTSLLGGLAVRCRATGAGDWGGSSQCPQSEVGYVIAQDARRHQISKRLGAIEYEVLGIAELPLFQRKRPCQLR